MMKPMLSRTAAAAIMEIGYDEMAIIPEVVNYAKKLLSKKQTVLMMFSYWVTNIT